MKEEKQTQTKKKQEKKKRTEKGLKKGNKVKEGIGMGRRIIERKLLTRDRDQDSGAQELMKKKEIGIEDHVSNRKQSSGVKGGDEKWKDGNRLNQSCALLTMMTHDNDDN